MIAGLLENQQKAKQAKQQAAVSAYMGDKAPAPAQGGGGGLLSGLGGLLQGGGAKKKAVPGPVPGPNGGKIDTVNPYGPGPVAGPNGGQLDMVNPYGAEPDADNFGGARDYDADDELL
jgi:hypothetical protein